MRGLIGDADRHDWIASALRNAQLDALLCCSSTEVLLLTGYCPVMSASVAVFTAAGEVAVVAPEDEVELAHKTSAARVIPYKPAGLDTLCTPLELLKKPFETLLGELKLGSEHYGLQMDEGVQPSSYQVAYQFRSALLELMKQLRPQAEFSPADELLEKMKAVKTAKEVELMASACKVASAGFERAAQCMEAGRRETAVAAEANSAFETNALAGEFQRSHGQYFCMSGPNSALAASAYARTRQRVLEEGDLVMVHANTCADGYWTDISRTYTVGAPSERQQKVRDAILKARDAALRVIRPGVTGRDVDGAARQVMEAHGLGKAFQHAAGHGVGFAAANPNGRPRIHPLSDDVLEAGMTFNLEPAAYFEGYGGMRHCDVVAVTANGVDVLTDF
jgi:Xaa-Pro aminopeptidase